MNEKHKRAASTRDFHRSTRKRSLLSSFWLPMAGSVSDFFAVLVASLAAFYVRFFGPVYEVFHSYWVPSAVEYLSFGAILGLGSPFSPVKISLLLYSFTDLYA